MYGEKVEEAEELRLDLQDVKDLYRAQVIRLTAAHLKTFPEEHVFLYI